MRSPITVAVITAALLIFWDVSPSRAQVMVVVPDPSVGPPPGNYFQPIYRNSLGYNPTPIQGPNRGVGTYYGGYATSYGPSRIGISTNSLFPAFDWSRLRKRH